MKAERVRLVLSVFLLGLLLWTPSLEYLLRFLFPQETVLVYPLKSPAALILEHMGMVFLTSTLAAFAGFLAAIVAFLSGSASMKRLIVFSGTVLQTIPPMAVLALLIPLTGFGNTPVFWALFFYGLLPVFHNAYGAMETVPQDVITAARGVGLSPLQIFSQVTIPLALPGILSGIRASLIINIGTATIGATMGAGGLGRPIIAGISQFHYSYLVQGALSAAVLALIVDSLFELFTSRRASRA
jgi:osmoprotectant transport system permease protein